MKFKPLLAAVVFLLVLTLCPQAVQADAGFTSPQDVAAAVVGRDKLSQSDQREAAAKVLATLLGWFITAGIKLIQTGAEAFAYIISAQFDGSVVRSLWVLVLSLVNLGFLLALVTIALLTTLRVEIGGGVQKLLPRLLIGALLVNFSLVICYVILDVVNIGVASLSIVNIGEVKPNPKSISVATVGQLPTLLRGKGAAAITDKSREFNPATQAYIGTDKSGWAEVTGSLITMMTVWAVAIAMWITVAFLALRYLVLMLLIGVSPVAYLAVAWPNMGSIAAKWWGKFLAWAFLPIGVMLVLALTLNFAAKVATHPDLAPTSNSTTAQAESNVVKALLATIVVAAGFIMSVGVGMYTATGASNAFVKVASKTGRMALGGALTTTGARRATREARAVFGQATAPIRKTMGWGEYSKFDDKGRLKKGKTTAFGLGERLKRGVGAVTLGAGGKEQREAGQAAQDIRAKMGTPAATATIAPSALRNTEAGKRLNAAEIGTLTGNALTHSTAAASTAENLNRMVPGTLAAKNATNDAAQARGQVINLVSNVEIVRKMEKAAQAAVFSSGDVEVIKALNNSLRTIAQQET